MPKQREFKIRSQSKKSKTVLKKIRREVDATKSKKQVRRPSTKEAIDRSSDISYSHYGNYLDLAY